MASGAAVASDMHELRQQQIAYNWIQFQQLYYTPESKYCSTDFTRAFLSKDGCNFVRRGILFSAVLDALGFKRTARWVLDVLKAYAISTQGMGNVAAMITNAYSAARMFIYPEEGGRGRDVISAVKNVLMKFKGR